MRIKGKVHSSSRPAACRGIVLAAALLLSACAASNSGPCTLSMAGDLPVITGQNAFFTDIVINDGLAHMRIDTGAATSLLSEAAASRLHLEQHMLQGASVRGVGGDRPVNLAVSRSVSLGAAHGAHLQFITAPAETLPPGTDGLLGMDFLSQFDDDLDFAAGHLRLVSAHGDCSVPSSPLRPPLYAVKFSNIAPSASPLVTVRINGKNLAAIIDSGATNTLLFRSAAARLGLPVDQFLARQPRAIRGVGGRARAVFGRLGTPVEIGALRISNLPLSIVDESSFNGGAMLLGFDFENAVHLWISNSSHTVLMQYPARPTPVVNH